MPPPNLKTCPFLGPVADGQQHLNRMLPDDYSTQPLKYLPPRVTLSDAELKLASQYEKGDFSGGYSHLKSRIFGAVLRQPSISNGARDFDNWRPRSIDWV